MNIFAHHYNTLVQLEKNILITMKFPSLKVQNFTAAKLNLQYMEKGYCEYL